MLDKHIIRELSCFVAACGELEDIVCGAVKHVALDNEVCCVNNCSGADVCRALLVGTGLTEAFACKTADVVCVEDIYKVSCCTISSTAEMLDGVNVSEDNVVIVSYVLHDEITV